MNTRAQPPGIRAKMWRLPESLIAQIADYRFESRTSRERDAVIKLLEAGLKAERITTPRNPEAEPNVQGGQR